MKIRQVKAFLAVVKTGSVRRASVELNLTQSTVAKAVSQLEAELGSPLFERSAQGLRLNEAGESLLPYAETIVANADKAAAAVSAIATGHFDKLRLSVTPTLPPCILADAMTHFRSRFPETKVIFSSGFLTDCLSQLVTDKLDLSVVMIGDHQRESLAALEEEPLFEVDQGVIASASHPIFKPGADVHHQLASCEWLTTVGDEPLLLSKLNSIGITAPRSLTICDFYGIDALNGRHNALSLSPLSVAEDERYENGRGRVVYALNMAVHHLDLWLNEEGVVQRIEAPARFGGHREGVRVVVGRRATHVRDDVELVLDAAVLRGHVKVRNCAQINYTLTR